MQWNIIERPAIGCEEAYDDEDGRGDGVVEHV